MKTLIFLSLLGLSATAHADPKNGKQCPATVFQGKDKFGWNDFDEQTLKKAKAHCAKVYPNSPCVKLFRKYGERDYTVLCGAETSST